ncbi:MAG: DUF3108 domain-containing protein [Candidatus Cloacimonadaceae bacterium]|nr:DUF3108 domain-containing protein [Candidatus Cloacimonadaceae bacterium]
MSQIRHLIVPLLAISFLASVLTAQARTTDYHIRSLGLNVASLSINHDASANTVSVHAKSLITNAIFPEIDNHYNISFNSSYLPQTYAREIAQKKVDDTVTVSYDHKNKRASAIHRNPRKSYSYDITADTRDFFTFMTMVSMGKAQAGSYVIDGNGTLWTAILSYHGRESIKTSLGNYSCRLYKVRFEPLSEEKTRYVDMVTFNVLSKSSRVSMWISDDGIAVKSNVRKGALSMSWEIREIRN